MVSNKKANDLGSSITSESLLNEIGKLIALPSDVINELEQYRINLSEPILPPEIALEIEVNQKTQLVGTKGNFSVIIGKAKSKKTFSLSLFLAEYLKKEHFKGVLYFDTEQTKYHVQKALKRLELKNGFISNNIKAYHLRSVDTDKRLEYIEQAIYSNDNIEIVIIDGIRDLIKSINDEEQATMIASKLLKWTEERNIHIITILHQNKGDNNARGHLGTELMNKAELVLSVTKNEHDKNISIVETVASRGVEVEEFAFSIDSEGVPNIIENWTKKEKEKTKKIQPQEINNATYEEILKKVFTLEKNLKFNNLVIQLDLAIQGICGLELGDNKIKRIIAHLVNNKLIIKNGKDRSPNANYSKS